MWQTHRQTDRQTHGQTDRQTDRHRDRQTDYHDKGALGLLIQNQKLKLISRCDNYQNNKWNNIIDFNLDYLKNVSYSKL